MGSLYYVNWPSKVSAKHFGKPEIYGIHAGALKFDIGSHTVH